MSFSMGASEGGQGLVCFHNSLSKDTHMASTGSCCGKNTLKDMRNDSNKGREKIFQITA